MHPNHRFFTGIALLIITVSILLRLFCMSSIDLLVEETYYWDYSNHLDFGYIDHPPMVALLIKLSTSIFGIHELSVRITSLLCWMLASLFGYKLSNLISKDSGIYAIMLLAILPFFFLQSLFITPDQPLIVCWTAALYYLYRALISKQSRCWYIAGIWIGLGLLSKYTIVLLGLSTLVYLCLIQDARFWFRRKEPYLCALIAMFIFSPVIYWNATHEWASFIFQGSRRFKSMFAFSLHEFVVLLLIFLMPLGVWSLWTLLPKESFQKYSISQTTQHFFQVFLLVPLGFFAFHSLSHSLRFNWMGPALIALIPWQAMLISKTLESRQFNIYQGWVINGIILLIIYGTMIGSIVVGKPEILNKKILKKMISWGDLVHEFNAIASKISVDSRTKPIFVPLDVYNLSSELSYYQAKFLKTHTIQQIYPVIGGHIFGFQSLMYRYWSEKTNLSGKTLILISPNPSDFDNLNIKQNVMGKSPIYPIWTHSQGIQYRMKPFYYKVVKIYSEPGKKALN